MSADEIAQMLEFQREIDVIYSNIRADFEDDRREIQHSLDTGRDEAVDDGLGVFHGDAEDR